MKYMLICLLALIFCFGTGYLLAHILQKKIHRPTKRFGVILLTAGLSLVILVILSLAYFSIYHHAGAAAQAALQGSDTVAVEKVSGGYWFNGPSDDRAIIFYAGAKVEDEAYAPMLLKLADAGFDCFLADMPFHFALLGSNTADKFIDAYDYETWVIAGHSMGGIAASGYAQEHPDTIDGIVMLASYPTAQVVSSIKLCSIYGSEDGCLDREQYEIHRGSWPENSAEYIIDGGNHAQFGDYGAQKGDGYAFITEEEQQDLTVAAIAEFFK